VGPDPDARRGVETPADDTAGKLEGTATLP
jgi:hypothetical protein